MKTAVFESIREIVYDEAGIFIQPGKEAMVRSRLNQRLRALNLTDEVAYLEYLERETAKEMVELLDVISTNVTHFYRERAHFGHLTKALQNWIAEGQTRFRVWCAASSTGEEPYTLAFTLAEAFGTRPIDWRILATDISTRVLRHAEQAVYSEESALSVPEATRRKYMTRERRGGESTNYAVRESIRSHMLFRRMNLSKPPFPMRGPLDVVFCRNVMIYFDDKVRHALVAEFRRLLKPGGLLVVGMSEGLVGCEDGFRRGGDSTYIKID